MNKRQQTELSYDLEKRLEQAAERIRRGIINPVSIARGVNALRTGRKIILPVPPDVKEWFEETEEFIDEQPEDH